MSLFNDQLSNHCPVCFVASFRAEINSLHFSLPSSSFCIVPCLLGCMLFIFYSNLAGWTGNTQTALTDSRRMLHRTDKHMLHGEWAGLLIKLSSCTWICCPGQAGVCDNEPPNELALKGPKHWLVRLDKSDISNVSKFCRMKSWNGKVAPWIYRMKELGGVRQNDGRISFIYGWKQQIHS